jgi:serine/threonine protein phosphatase PrpC
VDELAGSMGIDTFCGTTVCMALIQPLERTITVANIGDSRMVLKTNGNIFALTKDHNMQHPMERTRIQRAGGVVSRDQSGTERVMGVLNMTRSLGDRSLRPFVSPHPVVSRYTIRPDEDEYIIVGSDGLWDAVSNQDAMHIVDNYMNRKYRGRENITHNVARELVNVAVSRGSTDNITAIWIGLKKYQWYNIGALASIMWWMNPITENN